jgi:diaminopimelate decarboxylase
MPALVGLMAGLVDGIDVASAGRAEGGAGRRRRPRRGQLRRPRQARGSNCARRWPPACWSTSSRARAARAGRRLAGAGAAGARGPARQPRLRAQGLGHEDGRRAQAVRHRCRAGARGAARMAAMGLQFEGFHLFAGSQNLRAESICEAQQKSYALALRLAASMRRRRCASSTWAAASAFRTSRASSGSTWRPSAPTWRGWSSGRRARCPGAQLVIELGRYLVGEAGVYVTRVVDRKVSRGQVFLVCDGGLHHHLAASGNFGQVVRKNYPVAIGNRTRRARWHRGAPCADAPREVAFGGRPAVHAAGPAGRPHGWLPQGRGRRPGGRLPVRSLRRRAPARRVLPGQSNFGGRNITNASIQAGQVGCSTVSRRTR